MTGGQKLAQAEEAVNEARIEYEGRLKLQVKGYQSETAIAQAKAKLAAAEGRPQPQSARSRQDPGHRPLQRHR